MGESFDHGPAGWIRQSRKCRTQSIHNQMVVDFAAMSSMNFAILDFYSLISERNEWSIANVLTGTGLVPSRLGSADLIAHYSRLARTGLIAFAESKSLEMRIGDLSRSEEHLCAPVSRDPSGERRSSALWVSCCFFAHEQPPRRWHTQERRPLVYRYR